MHFYLFRPLSHVTGTPPWLLRPMRVSTSSELYPNTWLFFVFEYIGIQFFNSLTCDLRNAMPRQRSLTLTLIPREAENFPKSDKYFKHVPLPTYLICLSPKGLCRQVLFKLYDRSNLKIIWSLQDLNPFYGKLSVLKVFCFNRWAIELDDW